MTDAETIKELEWKLDQERHGHSLLRVCLDGLLHKLERKQALAGFCFDHAPEGLGMCRGEDALVLGQTQAYGDAARSLREVLEAK